MESSSIKKGSARNDRINDNSKTVTIGTTNGIKNVQRVLPNYTNRTPKNNGIKRSSHNSYKIMSPGQNYRPKVNYDQSVNVSSYFESNLKLSLNTKPFKN